MNLNPLELERAPRSRVRQWLDFAEERAMYESYRAEEAAWRASRGRTH